MKPKYGEKANLCYMDTDSFIIYIKTKDVYVDITKDNEAKFVTSNYELERPLPGEKIRHQINDWWKIMIKFVASRPKPYSYLIDDGDKNKKVKDTKKCVIKQKNKFKDYKNFLDANQLENEIIHLEKWYQNWLSKSFLSKHMYMVQTKI